MQAMYIFVYEKNQSKQRFIWIDSIFEARNICFELRKVGLLKYSNEKHALAESKLRNLNERVHPKRKENSPIVSSRFMTPFVRSSVNDE